MPVRVQVSSRLPLRRYKMAQEERLHEFLKKEDYYENNPVGFGSRKDYTCEHCGETIPKGEPHGNSFGTHKETGNGRHTARTECSSKEPS